MFHTSIKSFLSLSVLTTLAALAMVATALAGAEPSPAAAATAPVTMSAAEDNTDNDRTQRDEYYHILCDDTEQPENRDDEILFVVEVKMNGITWFEAETADGGRYLIKDVATDITGGGHGPVQIGGGVYYVCWD